MVFRSPDPARMRATSIVFVLAMTALVGCAVEDGGLAVDGAGGTSGPLGSGGAGGTATGGGGVPSTGGALADAGTMPRDGSGLDVGPGTGGGPGTDATPEPDGARDAAREVSPGDHPPWLDAPGSTGGVPSTGGIPGTGGGGAGGTPTPDARPDTPRDVADARPEVLEGPPDRAPDRPLQEDTAPDAPPDKPFVESDGSYFAEAPSGEAGPLVLSWSEEFDGPANTSVDSGKWRFVTWGPGSGAVNHEVQQYTTSTNNVFLDGSGHLVIRALHDPAAATPYTSGRIESRLAFGPGHHIEVRAKLPAGRGSFPAILMKGSTDDWPAGGALGLMEQYGQDKRWYYATAYAPDEPGSGKTAKTKHTFPDAETASADFHVYSLGWYQDTLVFQVDGQTVLTTTYAPTSPFATITQYFVLDVALGGDMGLEIDDTAFPMEMMVDYVRVYAF